MKRSCCEANEALEDLFAHRLAFDLLLRRQHVFETDAGHAVTRLMLGKVELAPEIDNATGNFAYGFGPSLKRVGHVRNPDR